MQFNISGIVAALLVAQQASAAALTAEQIVTSLNAADNVAKDATGLFNATTDDDFVKGYEGLSSLRDLYISVRDVVWALVNDRHKEGFSEADQQSICTALNEDAKIQETLLAAMTKAHATFHRTPDESRPLVWLYHLKGADGHLRYFLKDVVPTCVESIKVSYHSLSRKFYDIITLYAQSDNKVAAGIVTAWPEREMWKELEIPIPTNRPSSSAAHNPENA